MLGRQLTTDGREQDVAPAHEAMRLFAPIATAPGQLHLDTDEMAVKVAVGHAKSAGADVQLVRDEGAGRHPLGTAHADGTFDEAD